METILFWVPRILTFMFAFIIIIFSFSNTDNCNPLLFGLLGWEYNVLIISYTGLFKKSELDNYTNFWYL